MVVKYNDIVSVLAALGDEEKLQVAVRECAKGGLIAGGACALGGLILGPVGLAVGGTIGGCVAAAVSSNTFVPLSTILLDEMSRDTQKLLVKNVRGIVDDLDAGDAIELLTLLQGTPMLRERLISELKQFFRCHLNLTLAPGA